MENNKRFELMGLSEGTKVLLTNGETAEYIRLKQKNFVGVMKGTRYNIPVDMFEKVLNHEQTKEDILNDIENIQQGIDNKAKRNEDVLKSLKKGDYFYINKGSRQDAILFTFDSIQNNKIIGFNPITKVRTRIDKSFDFYKL